MEMNHNARKRAKGRTRGLYTSPVIQAKVRASYMQGVSKLQISRQQKLDYKTVGRILAEQSELMAAQLKHDFVVLGKTALDCVRRELETGGPQSLELALRVLRSLGVYTEFEDRRLAVMAAIGAVGCGVERANQIAVEDSKGENGGAGC